MRSVCVLIWFAACGRAGFDTSIVDAPLAIDSESPDAADPLFADCALHLAVDQTEWTGDVGEVTTRCQPHPGTAVGGARVVIDPFRDAVAELDGGTSCIEFGSPASLEPADALTLSAWVLPTHSDMAPHGVIAKRVAFQVASQYALFVQNSLASADINDATDRFSFQSPVEIGTWQQLTIVFDGRKATGVRVSAFRNGVLDTVAPDSESTVANLDSPFFVGCMPDGPSQSFIGRLDDVIVWTRALSEVEVMDWYARTMGL